MKNEKPKAPAWPRLRMFGCSTCGQIAVSAGSHWCRGEWKPFFDTLIRYDAVGEARRD